MLKSLANLLKMSTPTKYANLSKEQLVSRIVELEKQVHQHQASTRSRDGYEKNKSKKPFDFSKYHTRFIALRFSYMGWNYNGLAVQKGETPLPTVEGVLIEALNKCRLVPSANPSDFKFSRCGRTDKGVSALNQVISLKVRSNLTKEEQEDPVNDDREIDYVNVLNHLLPDDIKIHSIALRPPKGFDARFSCKARHYKYLFHKKELDLELMKKAAEYYKGEHDFRNFCKIDGSKQIVNYNRTVMEAQILKLDDDFYCFDLKGTAFLWHQVRNMIGVLFLIGQGLEKPEIVKDLLNIDLYSTKPVYEMGSDLPLILYDCSFEGVEWTTARQNFKKDKTHRIAYSNWVENHIRTRISSFMFDLFPDHEKDRVRINLGDGVGKVVGEYVPLAKRERMESFEVVNERYAKRQKRR
jgi:tRNA pseudouridine38/39 synthase